jgi:lauroyl/myristoyl acyltransferase
MTKSFQIYMFHLGVRIIELLPRSMTILIAKILALIGFLTAKKSRQIVKKNLMYCNQTEFSYNTFKTISNYAVCLTDKLRIPIFDYEMLKKMVDVSGESNFDKALSLNRGVILITAHLGNWDLAGVYVSYLGYPLTAVVEEIPGLSDFYNFLRTRTGMETVFMREREKMNEVLTKNRILVLLGDRDLTGRGIPVKFLSGEKKLPRGPAAFALKYSVPILFGYFVLNDSQNKLYKVEISEPIFPENQSLEELTQLIADRLSDYVSKFPLQWFVFKDEWLN